MPSLEFRSLYILFGAVAAAAVVVIAGVNGLHLLFPTLPAAAAAAAAAALAAVAVDRKLPARIKSWRGDREALLTFKIQFGINTICLCPPEDGRKPSAHTSHSFIFFFGISSSSQAFPVGRQAVDAIAADAAVDSSLHAAENFEIGERGRWWENPIQVVITDDDNVEEADRGEKKSPRVFILPLLLLPLPTVDFLLQTVSSPRQLLLLLGRQFLFLYLSDFNIFSSLRRSKSHLLLLGLFFFLLVSLICSKHRRLPTETFHSYRASTFGNGPFWTT